MEKAQTRKLTVRNPLIELFRFLLCIIVFLHHSGWVKADPLLPAGSLAADMFFVLTGYFGIRHVCERGTGEKPLLFSIRYTIKKLANVFPYVAAGTLSLYLLDIFLVLRNGSPFSCADLLCMLRDLVVELSFLSLAGLMPLDITLHFRNAPTWYLSAVLLGLPLLLWLCQRLGKAFRRVVVWVLPVALYAILMSHFDGLSQWGGSYGIFKAGFLRGLAGMSTGGAIYCALSALSARFPSVSERAPLASLTALETALYLLFFWMIVRGAVGMEKLIALGIAALAAALSLSNLTHTSRMHSRAALYLGRLSMPIYCIHWAVYRYVSFLASYLDLDWRIAMALAWVLSVIGAQVLMSIFTRRKSRV